MFEQSAATTAVDNDTDTLLRESINDYCARALPPSRLRALRQTSPRFDLSCWREMADLGWLGMVVPESLGGLEMGANAVAIMGHALGRVAAVEPVIEAGVACSALLAGTVNGESQLAALLSGEALFTTSLANGAEITNPLRAVALADGYELHGTVAQLPVAPDVDYFLLVADCDGEPGLFVVPRAAAGLSLEALTLADGTCDGRVHLESVRCPAADRLHTKQAISEVLERARALAGLGASAYLLGLGESLLDITAEYLRVRRQFGRPIGTFQALQHRLVDMYLHLRLSKAALSVALEQGDEAATPALTLMAARARHRACATTTRIVREAIQLHGAIGYTEQCDVSLYVQRALVMSARFGGARTVLAASRLALGAEGDAAAVLPPPLPADFRPTDGDWNSLDDALFRSTVRHWLEAHYPPELRHVPDQLRWSEIKGWHAQLVAQGWAAPAWPVAHGGMGLAPNKMLIFIEELERWGVARAPDQGIVMIGPILMSYGSPEQREQYLPAALTGEQIWCQGYSEPEAGSDLAALATRAVLDGDEFIVNGQKTWTTHGLDATHMYCLVRTDPNVKPQAGISFLLIDLRQPGVTVRPIVNLGGHVDFCEVFLDNVRVPRHNLVGELNAGWTIAKSLLGHERLFVGSPKLCQHAVHQLRELLVANGQIDNAATRDALTAITLDVLDLEALYGEYAAIVKQGGVPGVDISVLKIWSTETYVRLSEMILEAAGDAAGIVGKQAFGDARIDVLSHFYNARPAPIYAGSNEIQRNILAKQVLRLPT